MYSTHRYPCTAAGVFFFSSSCVKCASTSRWKPKVPVAPLVCLRTARDSFLHLVVIDFFRFWSILWTCTTFASGRWSPWERSASRCVIAVQSWPLYSLVSIVLVCAINSITRRKCRNCSGNQHWLLRILPLLVVPICAKRFHGHCSWQPAL